MTPETERPHDGAAGHRHRLERRIRAEDERADDRPLGAEVSSDDIDMVRFPGEQAMLELQVGPTAVLESPGGPLGLEPLSERLAPLSGLASPRARMLAGERAPAVRTRLVRRRPPVEAEVGVDLVARDERLAETFTFSCRPVAGELDAVVVHFSEPMGSGLEWSMADPLAGSLAAQPLDPGDATRGDLRSDDAVAESWLVELRPATAAAVRFRAVRTVPLEAAVPVPLAWVEAAEQPGGTVAIRGEAGERPEIANHRLRELPPGAESKAGVLELAYGAPRQIAGVGPAAELLPPSIAAAARAWAWRQSTVCWCYESGGLEWETTFDVENLGRDSVSLALPEGLRVERVIVAGEPVAAALTGSDASGLAIPLPPGSGRISILVRGVGGGDERFGWWRIGDVSCGIDVPVLERDARLMLPPGLVTNMGVDGRGPLGRLFGAVSEWPADQFTKRGFGSVLLTDGGNAGMVVVRRRWIWSLAFSPDGQQLASSGAEQLVRLWNVAPLRAEPSDTFHTLTAQTMLRGHTDTVFTVAFSPDGQQLASGSADQSICLWQVATGTLVNTFCDHVGPIFTLAFDPTGTLLASAGRDRVVRIWDLAARTLCHHCIGHTEEVIDLRFHYVTATGITWLITGSRDQSVRLWASDSGQLHHTLVDANNEILAIAASPGGHLLAASGADHMIRCWDLTTMQLRYSFSGHGDAVRALAFSADGITLASGGNDQTIRLWDTEKRRALYTIQGYKNEISALAISPDGTLLANGNANHVIYLWPLQQPADLPPCQGPTPEPQPEVQPRQALHGHYGAVRAVAFHPDGSLLVSGGDDDSIRLWQLAAGRWTEHQILRGHMGAVLTVAFSPDGQLLATGSADTTIRLWDLQRMACTHIVRGHKKMVNALAFSLDGQYLASVDDGGMLLLHQTSDLMAANKLGSGQAIWRMDTDNSALFTLAFSQDSQLLAIGGAEKTIQLWQINERRLVTSWAGHSSSIYTLAFSPDGRYLASGSGDQQICLWVLPSGALYQRWSGHSGLVCALRFDPTGQLLISGSADQTIRLWRIGTPGEPQLLHPPGPYRGLNISGTIGLTRAKRAVLKALGAVEQS